MKHLFDVTDNSSTYVLIFHGFSQRTVSKVLDLHFEVSDLLRSKIYWVGDD